MSIKKTLPLQAFRLKDGFLIFYGTLLNTRPLPLLTLCDKPSFCSRTQLCGWRTPPPCVLPIPTYSLSLGQHLGLWRHSPAPGRQPELAASNPAWKRPDRTRVAPPRRRGAFSKSPTQIPRVRTSSGTAVTPFVRQCPQRRKSTAEQLPVRFSMCSVYRFDTCNYGSVSKWPYVASGLED